MDWYPLWNSLRIAAISCVIVFFSGIGMAYYVAKLPRIWKGILDVVLTLPLVLPPTVCGWLLLLVFGLKHPVGIFLQSIGVQFVMTWYGGIIASAVVAFPLMYRTARGAFESFDETLAWSGRTLGLSGTYIFWHIRMPYCKQGIIEIHDATAAAPIVFKGLFAKLFRRKIVADLFIQQFPVGVTEPVDTLFYVAHNQVVTVVRKAFR